MTTGGQPLAGKVALVTGAGSGIGRAAAIALAVAGGAISICGRREALLEEVEAQAREHGAPVRRRSVDVADHAAVQRWVDDAREAFGRIDVLVNSAGTNVPERTWANTSLDGWREIVETNLTGIFLCTRAVLPIMRARRDGLVINVSSLAGVQASLVSGVAYSASKFGVVSLTQSLNLEEWRNGIRATVICPGEVATPIMAKRPNPPPAHAHALMVQPEDLGATIAFVAALPARAVIEQIIIRPTVRQY
jgi:NAD(P)-dependent dehydrogenase (short-subunit alcohol dehydrogenase family)